MGGRVPVNGTAVSGIPGMFPTMPDPRYGFLTPQQQYAFAYEQVIFHAVLRFLYLLGLSFHLLLTKMCGIARQSVIKYRLVASVFLKFDACSIKQSRNKWSSKLGRINWK